MNKRFKATEDNINKLFVGVPVKQVLFLRDSETPEGGNNTPIGCNMCIILENGVQLTVESEITTELTLEQPNGTKDIKEKQSTTSTAGYTSSVGSTDH